MSLTFDWANKVVESSASILDLPAFHAALRDAEVTAAGMLSPVIHTWKALDQTGGAFLYQIDFINGWQLKFPNPGNYEVTGNLNAPIIPVAGTFVKVKTSTAYITTAIGGSGPSASDIAAAVGQRVVEGSVTLEQILRLLLAYAAGDATGLESPNIAFKSLDGTKTRIGGTINSGNRTVSVRDGV